MINQIQCSATFDHPTIALVIGTLNTEYDHLYWQGVLEVMQTYSANILCLTTPMMVDWEQSSSPPTLHTLCNTSQIDGLVVNTGVIMNYFGSHALTDLYKNYEHLPIVNMAIPFDDRPVISVENYTGMYELVSHLITAHGLSHIACLRGRAGHPEAEERFAGYHDALRDHNVPLSDDLVITLDDFNVSTGKAGTISLIERGVVFDAIVAQSDNMALGVLQALGEHGLSVPEDVVVTGFDNMERMEFLDPPLSTVSQSVSEQIIQAVHHLMKQLKDGNVPDSFVMPTQAIFRRSCGCDYVPTTYEGKFVDQMIHKMRLIEQNSRIFMSALDWHTLSNSLAERLPLLDIHRCYITLFNPDDNSTDAQQNAQLVSGFDESGTLNLPPDGVCFPADTLLPAEIWSRLPSFRFVVCPLQVHEEMIGYVLMEIGSENSQTYENIRAQLSMTVKTILLLLSVQQNATQLEKRVQEQTSDLIHLLDEHKDWMKIVTHDLRNLAFTIQLTGKGLLRHWERFSAESIQKRIDDIVQISHRMEGIISRLMEDSRTYNQSSANNHKIDLIPVVKTALAQGRPALQNKQIQLRTDIPSDLVFVHADPDLVQQVLDNLLSNAIKYSSSRTTITVRVQQEVQQEDKGVCLAVQDEGDGLSADDQARLFSKYGRLSAKPTAGESSMGLGLYNVHNMVEAMGARVSAESLGKGHGSTFKVWFPIPN